MSMLTADCSEPTKKICIICYEDITPQPIDEQEQERILDCSHVFHRECIGEWLKQKHNCPICRTPVEINTPKAPTPERTVTEILPIPDYRLMPFLDLADSAFFDSIRSIIQSNRYIRRIDLTENTQVGRTAAKVHLVASLVLIGHH